MVHESEPNTNDTIQLRTAGREKDKECEKDRYMNSSTPRVQTGCTI